MRNKLDLVPDMIPREALHNYSKPLYIQMWDKLKGQWQEMCWKFFPAWIPILYSPAFMEFLAQQVHMVQFRI
jgi:hypothetical protein